MEIIGNSEDSVSRELMPNDIKERLIRLEHENKILRQNQGNQGDQASVQVIRIFFAIYPNFVHVSELVCFQN